MIAVIVPFLNAVDTLPRLVDALKAQTFGGFTAVFVDDGSSDGGRQFLEEVCGSDSRFVLLDGWRRGPGAARNVGLDEVERRGVDYVTFVDADDLPDVQIFERAVSALEESGADIVHYPWRSSPSGPVAPDAERGPSIYVWNKTYRRSAVRGIRFAESKFAEDLAFFLETETRAPRRVALNEPLYVHFMHPGSLWESRRMEDIADSVEMVFGHLDPLLAVAGGRVFRDWRRFYLSKLVKMWAKGFARSVVPPDAEDVMRYVRFVNRSPMSWWQKIKARYAVRRLGGGKDAQLSL